MTLKKWTEEEQEKIKKNQFKPLEDILESLHNIKEILNEYESDKKIYIKIESVFDKVIREINYMRMINFNINNIKINLKKIEMKEK